MPPFCCRLSSSFCSQPSATIERRSASARSSAPRPMLTASRSVSGPRLRLIDDNKECLLR